MKENLYDALEICLGMMDEGASLEQCLERFPNLADELGSILMAASAAKSLADPAIQVEAMNRSRTSMLGKAKQMQQEQRPRQHWMGASKLAFSMVILAALFVLTSGSLFVASAKSLPGDTLYPVKWAVAYFQVKMADGAEKRSVAENQFRMQRIVEVQQLLDRQLVRKITFDGIVEKVSPEQWQVSGIRVRVSDNTVIIGMISEGMLIEVEGLTEKQGYVSAHKIFLREFQVTGVVEKIAAEKWIISGMPVKITSETQLSLGINERDVVLVLIKIDDDDRSWVAKAILNLGESTQSLIPVEILPSSTESTSPDLDEDEQSDEDASDDGSMDEDRNDDDTDEAIVPTSSDDDDGDKEEIEDQEESSESEGTDGEDFEAGDNGDDNDEDNDDSPEEPDENGDDDDESGDDN